MPITGSPRQTAKPITARPGGRAWKKERNYPTEPSERALQLAVAGANRVRQRNARIRRSFVRRQVESEAPPPLARFIRGGRGGQVRLKLYLSVLWIAVGEGASANVVFPARAWAELLDLPDPEVKGARRVVDAFNWMESNSFIRKGDPRPGRPTEIILLHESGTGAAYVTPGTPPEPGESYPPDDRYFQLPPDFWTSGWLAVLSAPALAMLLVMLEFVRNPSSSFFIAPALAKRHYAVSEDTWTEGIAELRWHGLIKVNKRSISEDFGWRRVRNEYTINWSRFKEAPGS